MKNQDRFTKPPRELTRLGVQLNNFSLVPASLLPDMSAYKALSDRQPKGTVVIVLPTTERIRHVYDAIVLELKSSGKRVLITTSGSCIE